MGCVADALRNKNITLNHAAQLVGVDKSSLSRMVERLVRRNLVIRSEGDDRRSLGLTLTPAARKLVPQLAKLADQNDELFFKTLSQKQRENFLGRSNNCSTPMAGNYPNAGATE